MAKYRIRWRNIFFNIPILIMMVESLRYSWPRVKEALKDSITDQPDVADFIAKVDEVYRILIVRKRG